MKGRRGGNNLVDLAGRRFGRLVVLGRADPPSDRNRHARWRCRCDCGAELAVASHQLGSGVTRSCGCLRQETARDQMRAINRSLGRRVS